MTINVWLFLEFSAVYILLTWAFYFPLRGGQFFNAPVYILAISSYFSAYAMREWGWAYGPTLLATIGIGALVGFAPAYQFAKIRGLALAVATFAGIFIVQAVLRSIPFLGGTRGFFSIPEVNNLLPITWVIVLIIGVIIHRIDHSRLGRAIEIVRVHTDMAGTLGGVNPIRMSVLVQTIGGAISGAAGAIYPFISGNIYPASFNFSLLLYIWTITFVGGQNTMWGAIVFAPLLWGMNQVIPHAIAEYTDFIFGALLITILLLRPEGAIDKRLVSNIGKFFRGDGHR